MDEAGPSRLCCGVLFSGQGTTARSLLDYAQSQYSHFQIDFVLTNNPEAPGRAVARDYATDLIVLPDTDQNGRLTRQQWDAQLHDCLQRRKPDLIILAGFMRILSAQFVSCWKGKIVNIHPSLLPKYKGLNTHQRAIEGQEKQHGFSVHLVTPALDAGPILAQGSVAVTPSDTPQTLQQKVQIQERHYFPQVIDLIAQGRLRWSDERVLLDNVSLPAGGIQVCDAKS